MKDEAKAGDLQSGGAPASGDARPAAAAERCQSEPRSAGKLDDFTRTRLGTHLRTLYGQMAQQPVPDRFRELIARLEAAETEAPRAPGEEDLDGSPA